MSLSLFHPIIREWFNGRFEAPTEAQAKGWTAISEGRHTLIAAPTGSGKTLAAFLTCIDGLVRAGMEGSLPDTTQVVYVSPLKALSNDIQKNLAAPLEEIQALAEESGSFLPDIRTAVRTGDTKASERQRMAKKPPHILITTPESLYILLTSQERAQGSGGSQDPHTGRDPRRRRRQARLPSDPVRGAAVQSGRGTCHQYRAVGHTEAH